MLGGDTDMIYTKLTIKAINIAYEAHQGQKDISGVPYIFHPFHVAEQMTDEITVCVALLHDVVEDTDVTIEDLAEEFPTEIVEAVRLLTHRDGDDYREYIKNICANPVALTVKLGDIEHNMDESRLCDKTPEIEKKLAHWRRKYSEAKKIIEEEINS